MKIYQKIGFSILMMHAKKNFQIPSISFFLAPVSPQTFQCLLVPRGKRAIKLYRGVGVEGVWAVRGEPPFSVRTWVAIEGWYRISTRGMTDRPAAGIFAGKLFRRLFRRSVLLPFSEFSQQFSDKNC